MADCEEDMGKIWWMLTSDEIAQEEKAVVFGMGRDGPLSVGGGEARRLSQPPCTAYNRYELL